MGIYRMHTFDPRRSQQNPNIYRMHNSDPKRSQTTSKHLPHAYIRPKKEPNKIHKYTACINPTQEGANKIQTYTACIHPTQKEAKQNPNIYRMHTSDPRRSQYKSKHIPHAYIRPKKKSNKIQTSTTRIHPTKEG